MKLQAIELIQKILRYMYCYRGSGMLINEYSHQEVLTNAKSTLRILRPEFDPVLNDITVFDFWTKDELER